jgi:hypothetical protein
MEDYLKKQSLKKSDEAWLVVDKDSWTEKQLLLLNHWALSQENYRLALSNPKFEFWLLLHFEDGDGVTNSRNCSEHLKRHMPDYDKGIDISKITHHRIISAIKRATKRDNPPCVDWPRNTGTTVYRLVENIINSNVIN